MEDTSRPVIDSSVPQSARIWNYWLGGKDHFAVDRAAGDEWAKTQPGIAEIAVSSRASLGRIIRYLVAEAGLRQFLDIGTGLPTADNTHEIAQRSAPECRVMYVDNDPLVLAHARALLVGRPEGATNYIHADVCEPALILDAARETLDFTQPVGLILFGVLGLVSDDEVASSTTRYLIDSLPGGSHVVIGDDTNTDPQAVEAERRYALSGGVPYRHRSPEQFREFFAGLEILPPGLVRYAQWRPHDLTRAAPSDSASLVGVARKP